MSWHNLPDFFIFNDGSRLQSTQDWQRRRSEMLEIILKNAYGLLPPIPECINVECLIDYHNDKYFGARHTQYRISMKLKLPFEFIFEILFPTGQGPFPVVLTGDACWRQPSDDIIFNVLKRNYAFAAFNRVSIVPDINLYGQKAGLYAACQQDDFGALSAWAWGYHRCVDILFTLSEIDTSKITVTGHSRGGKAALIAGATDERIALTVPNNSGCAGAGCFRFIGTGSETLEDIVGMFPYWFNHEINKYLNRVNELPFDQHWLKACVAPRGLLSTEALDDLWANPRGSMLTYLAAREVYKFLNITDKIGILFRQGTHEQGLVDWLGLLEFADWHFYGKFPAKNYNHNPFLDLPSP